MCVGGGPPPPAVFKAGQQQEEEERCCVRLLFSLPPSRSACWLSPPCAAECTSPFSRLPPQPPAPPPAPSTPPHLLPSKHHWPHHFSAPPPCLLLPTDRGSNRTHRMEPPRIPSSQLARVGAASNCVRARVRAHQGRRPDKARQREAEPHRCRRLINESFGKKKKGF